MNVVDFTVRFLYHAGLVDPVRDRVAGAAPDGATASA